MNRREVRIALPSSRLVTRKGINKEISWSLENGTNLTGAKMKTSNLKNILVVLIGLCLPWTVQAGKFRFPVGISYANGFQEAIDDLSDWYRQDGFDVDQMGIPVGLTFDPYYEWDSGIGVGISVGPTAFMYVEENYYGYNYSSENTHFSYAVPVGAFVRYTLFRDKTVSPYVRVGVRYPIAGGDNLGDSEVGPFGAIGVEFLRTKKVGVSVEVGYDASKVTVKYPSRGWSEEVTLPGFTAGVSVVF
jgi:hypothetical protein